MGDPYLIHGPAIISFSGGRTSGYLLRQIMNAHAGTLPDDVKVVFCNTGKEHPRTLDFVQDVSNHWGVPITWLEYRWEPVRHYYEVVNHNSASRNGEPFEMLLKARTPFMPTPASRFCSTEMKVRTIKRYAMQELGWERWLNVIGLRADEPRRVAKMKHRNEVEKQRWESVMPMAQAGATKADVTQFWASQMFDLRLTNFRGITPAGNCDLCFMKSYPTLMRLIREAPESADWWIEQERVNASVSTRTMNPAAFRNDRPSYAKMKATADKQHQLFDDESAIDCACTD